MKTLRMLPGLVFVGSMLVGAAAEAQFAAPAPEPPRISAPPTAGYDPFLPPPGMVTVPDCLLSAVGFYGHQGFVYSAANCFDLASACYKYGYFEDAIALLSHAIEQDPQARYFHLRGLSQMRAGLNHDAIASADGVWSAQSAGHSRGLATVRERFNGPVAVQFRQLLLMRAPQERGEG